MLTTAASVTCQAAMNHPLTPFGNRHPELVYTRFAQRYSGDDKESGHFNGKQIDTTAMFAN